MKIISTPGRKTKYGRDEIVSIETDGLEKIKYTDLLKILQLLFDNEDRIYPKEKGFKGSDMLFNCIKAVKLGVPIDTLNVSKRGK